MLITRDPPPPTDLHHVGVDLGTRHSCSTTCRFIISTSSYQIPHLLGPHILPVLVSVGYLPVRSSETDDFTGERADVTSPLNEALAYASTNRQRVQRLQSINLVTLFLRRGGLGCRLFPGVISLPHRMEDTNLKG